MRIFGKHLRGVRVITVAGYRMTRPRFPVTDGAEPHIEAELPRRAVAGPITVLTMGGVAADQFRLEDSGATERPKSSPRRRTPG